MQASLSFYEERPKKPDSEIIRYSRDFLLQFSLVRSLRAHQDAKRLHELVAVLICVHAMFRITRAPGPSA